MFGWNILTGKTVGTTLGAFYEATKLMNVRISKQNTVMTTSMETETLGQEWFYDSVGFFVIVGQLIVRGK